MSYCRGHMSYCRDHMSYCVYLESNPGGLVQVISNKSVPQGMIEHGTIAGVFRPHQIIQSRDILRTV